MHTNTKTNLPKPIVILGCTLSIGEHRAYIELSPSDFVTVQRGQHTDMELIEKCCAYIVRIKAENNAKN